MNKSERDGETMRTTDWNYDFASLPHWENRNTLMAYDQFHEIPQQNALCCIYSIKEVSMCNYVGFLAILKEKDDPTLLINISKGMNFCDNFSVSEDGRFIFLQPSIYDERRGRKRPILVINLVENRFSYVLTNNTNPCYHVKQKSTDVFVVEAQESQQGDQRLMEIHGIEIHITALQWYELNKLPSLRELISPEKPENVAP